MSRTLDIGIVTDEVSRNLADALETARSWGLTLFELREGGERRFPYFTTDEVGLVEEIMRSGSRITAVSPGIFKGNVSDRRTIRQEIDEVLPRSIEMARRFESPMLIVFGFERRVDDDEDRTLVMDALTEAAEAAASADLTVAIENEPNFWFDQPAGSVDLLTEIDHPTLQINWDPANQHWGGARPNHESFKTLRPHLVNIHVKDFYPDDPKAPWRPVGTGATPWEEILGWIIDETDLGHATVETHCMPLVESSRQSVDKVRSIIKQKTNR